MASYALQMSTRFELPHLAYPPIFCPRALPDGWGPKNEFGVLDNPDVERRRVHEC